MDNNKEEQTKQIINIKLEQTVIDICQALMDSYIEFDLDDIVKQVNYTEEITNRMEVDCLVHKRMLNTYDFDASIMESSPEEYRGIGRLPTNDYNVSSILNYVKDTNDYIDKLPRYEAVDIFESWNIPRIPCVFEFFNIEPFILKQKGKENE